MSFSVGDYKKARKNGLSKWGKVICHVSPVNSTGKVVTSLSQTVEFWPADQAIPGLLTLAEAKAKDITSDGKSYKKFIFEGDNVPEDYQDMFSFMGELRWEYIEFEESMVKVHRSDDNNKVVQVKDENGKPIVKEGETLAYWVGDMITSGLQLSREYRLARMMRDWMPISATVSSEEETEEQGTDNKSGLAGEN